MASLRVGRFLMGIVVVASLSAGVVRAADQSILPTRLTFVKEWVSIHLLTWNQEAKVLRLNQAATQRTNDIKTATDQGARLDKLTRRYEYLTSQVDARLAEGVSPKAVATVKDDILKQQATLSVVRQAVQDDADKEMIAQVQARVVNQTKAILKDKDAKAAAEFSDQVVTVWRDPAGSVKDEKATRVYAAGTTASGNANDGVVIDQGEGKITEDGSGNLKIEYAPGTGPSSVTSGDGRRVWKITQSDGTVVESYSPAGQVVIGQSSGTATNIIVNTGAGGTSTGTAAHTVVNGGAPVAQTGRTTVAPMESGSPAADPSQSVPRTINSTNGLNTINSTEGSGSSPGQVEPAAPVPMQ